ncbi:hypothetical protein [uncultured Cohaesibacter sp.]|uniref:hypothetical protein n=1 Tax=uncultured Cohaesibacter sp. TaxID=1002546 RepID=UPI002931EF75|nr:hypothetical protein [uncultured Cohaesibacter sp.]
MENVPGTLRLLLMNLYLHDIDSEHVDLGDTPIRQGAAAWQGRSDPDQPSVWSGRLERRRATT